MPPPPLLEPAATSPDEAVALLQSGNERFASDSAHRESYTARRLELTSGQRPFAVVLGCSDSRVPIETIFDQAPGHIFVIRVAGNFVADDGLGSIEYGIAALHAPLVLVLGHGSCGAVTAAVTYVEHGTTQPSYIMSLVRAIEPSVRSARPHDGDSHERWVDEAIERNVRDNVDAITLRSPLVAAALAANSVAVRGAIYDLHTGRVRFL